MTEGERANKPAAAPKPKRRFLKITAVTIPMVLAGAAFVAAQGEDEDDVPQNIGTIATTANQNSSANSATEYRVVENGTASNSNAKSSIIVQASSNNPNSGVQSGVQQPSGLGGIKKPTGGDDFEDENHKHQENGEHHKHGENHENHEHEGFGDGD